jgi:hypothetical protein
MAAGSLAGWVLEREARALLARLERVHPFVLAETMVPAAALSPAASSAIDRYLIRGRRSLGGEVRAYVRWLRGPGRAAPPAEMQRRFTVLKLRFNRELTQLDLFSEAVTQRSENQTGVWLSGLDVAAAEALTVPGRSIEAPPIICLVHRGLGGAIRRARTRLPGGGSNPASIIRIPRERMIGYGIASSLVHEVGHQAAALFGLVQSLRLDLQRMQRERPASEQQAWKLWERWISEIVADFWAIGKVGISSTLGLIGVVSLPRWFVFRMNPEDPHPFAWIRVMLSCAVGEALYPHPQWRQLADTFRSLYPLEGVAPEMRRTIASLVGTMPAFVRLLATHRPPGLSGASLAEIMPLEERTPARLVALYNRWRRAPEDMRRAAPSLAFAVLGQARASGRITPEQETELLGKLIVHWAVRSALDTAAVSARTAPSQVMPLGQPAIWLGRSALLRATRPKSRPRSFRRPPRRPSPGQGAHPGRAFPAVPTGIAARSAVPGPTGLGRSPVSARR